VIQPATPQPQATTAAARGEGVVVGIDVSAKTLAVATRADNGRVYVREVPNTPTSHASLCARLAGSGAKVCLEATGIYHLDVARALKGADGVEVMVVNPRAAHNFASAMSKRNKTDVSDAEVLLAFAERMEWVPWQAPSEAAFDLRTICRHAVSLRQALAADKARLARTKATSVIASAVADDIVDGMAQVEKRIEKLQAACLDLIGQDPVLSRQLARLCTIPGLGPISAVQLLSELAVLPGDMSAKQWTAHAGLDPREHQSGTSIDKAARISRAGNRYVRRALYMPALVALQYSPHVKAFYEGKVMSGKPKKKAIVAVMRKLLHAIWGMMRSDADWDGQRFHVLATATATAPVSDSDAPQVKTEVASSTAASRDAAPSCQSPEPPPERRPPIAHASAVPPRAAAGKGAPKHGGTTGRRVAASAQTRPLPAASTVAC